MIDRQGVEPSQQGIIIFGASARAAAFSAFRAGLHPWCADLFADEDLRARCSTIRLSSKGYPKDFEVIAKNGPPGPWMFTGGLENHPALVQRISEHRVLWGNNADVLAQARSPSFLAEIFRANGICFPVSLYSSKDRPREGRWLVKPHCGAGGIGIEFLSSQSERIPKRIVYFQEYLEGIPCSAVFVGFEKEARFLGATRQLIGETWLNAALFRYCGSVGPLVLKPSIEAHLTKIGDVLHRLCNLRGLFGVDFILANGIPWPVEVNPRYPASAEILEYAGVPAFALHRAAFDSTGPSMKSASKTIGAIFGKAIFFAERSLKFPADGPWRSCIQGLSKIEEMPDFADIPAAGSAIDAGHPTLTFFSRSNSVIGCIENLQHIARDLDHQLKMT
jgi:predicted ATP-grasp superfamily ATP-dependent carboligase